MPKNWFKKGFNLLSKLYYFMSFKNKNFLRFSHIINFYLRFTSWIHIFCNLLLTTLNCHNPEPVRDFDLIPALRARPRYQLSSDSLVVEDYTQQNRGDYTQQNHDWAVLENPKIDTLDPNFEKTTMPTYKSKYISKLVRQRLTLKYIHVKPL